MITETIMAGCFNFQRSLASLSKRCLGGYPLIIRSNTASIVQQRSFGFQSTQFFGKLNSKALHQSFSKSCKRLLSTNIATNGQKYVGYWLIGCCGTIAGAVSLGGVTRLTESGLSMVDWHIIRGMKKPLSQEEWENEFEKYQNFPEYKLARQGMTLSEFKTIWHMEYFHRMWGRFVGLAFVIPAIYFFRKGYFSKAMKPRVFIYATLIGMQGLLGWYMVKSGLKEETMSPTEHPHVSQYRLAAHLGMAFTLYSLMLWQGLSHLLKQHQMESTLKLARLKKWSHAVLALTFFTSISGAFVAGIKGGLVYNSFPKMADRWIPDDILALKPWYKNIFDNPTTTQFNHRVLGTLTLSSIVAMWCLARPVALPARVRLASNLVLAMSFTQVGLGIATLLMYVPTHLAATHQLGSLTLLSLALWFNHELRGSKVPK